jgi:hypothetical protein
MERKPRSNIQQQGRLRTTLRTLPAESRNNCLGCDQGF